MFFFVVKNVTKFQHPIFCSKSNVVITSTVSSFSTFCLLGFSVTNAMIVILNSLLKIRVYVIELRLFTVDSSCYSNGYNVIEPFILKEKILDKNIVYTTVFQRQL